MKLGIYGGAFNPIHNGHVIIAIEVLERLNLDKLIVVPTYNPPHRSKEDFAPYEYRKRWAEIVFKGERRIFISDYEKEKGGISYSIDTVKYYSEEYSVKPFFIIGEDSAINFDKWYRYEELKRLANFVVYPRFRKGMFDFIKRVHPEFFALEDFPLVEISSTDIRERIREGKSIRGMVDRSIEDEVVETYRRIFSKKR